MALRPAPVRRRALSMTSLIDVIFLLLLFFMLSSTFTRFAEIELAAAGAGGGGQEGAQGRPVFLTLGPDSLRLNGTPQPLDKLKAASFAEFAQGTTSIPVLVSLQGEVTAQRLADLLVVLRQLPRLRVTVLESA